MLIEPLNIGRIVAVRLNSGDDILACLEEAVKREDIKSAVILSGVGSTSSYHYHVVGTREIPPVNAFEKGEAAMDIVNINGMVLDGRVHAHITFADTAKALGGHMEPGCRVLTFAVVVIAVIEGAELGRWDSFDIMGN